MTKKLLFLLVLLMTAATNTWAQTETLLTTITATAKEQASYSTANVATVSFSYTSGGSSAYLANWGWWGYGWIATVNAAEGYTITKCIFYDDANRTATDSEAPFVVETTEEDKTPRINGTPIDGGNMWSKGIKKIEVYGYVTPTATKYAVTLADGTEDATNWQGKAGEGEYQALPLTGLEAGTAVTATYSGTKKVLGMTVAKKSAYEHSITIAVDPSTTGAIATAPAMTIEFKTGETWTDVAARYDWLETYMTYTVSYTGNNLMGNVHDANGGVKPDDTIDPNGSYHWGM